MDIQSLDQVTFLQEQYDKARSLLENQERQIISYLIQKNKDLISDNTSLRGEIRQLKEDQLKLMHMNSVLNAEIESGGYVRPFQAETLVTIPGDTSPLAYLSPNNLSLEEIPPLNSLPFEEYAVEVYNVLATVRQKVEHLETENDCLTAKVTDMKSLNQQLWSEVNTLRKRNSQLRQVPRPNTPSQTRGTPKAIFNFQVSPSSRSMTPCLSTWAGDSPEWSDAKENLFNVSNTNHQMRRARGVNRQVQKFKPCKQWGSGSDPNGAYVEFIKRDVVKNIDVHRDTVQRVDDLNAMRDKVALGCTKNLGKSRSHEGMGFTRSITGSQSSARLPQANFLGIGVEKQTRPFQNVVNTIIKQPKFTKSTQSSLQWAPDVHKVSMGNCVSTTYDPISFIERQNPVIRRNVNIDVKRTKGVTEFADLMRPQNPNPNPDFLAAINKDSKVFMRKTGIFTHMYEAAARHGYMTMPFEKAMDAGGKPAFKC